MVVPIGTYLNKLTAIDAWVKAEKKDAELQNIIAEQKIRTQRILGGLLSEKDFTGRGGDRGNQYTQPSTSEGLATYGLNKKQSSTFQQIASIPDDTFV